MTSKIILAIAFIILGIIILTIVIIILGINIHFLKKDLSRIRNSYFELELRNINNEDAFFDYKFEQNKLNRLFKAHLNFIVDEEEKDHYDDKNN